MASSAPHARNTGKTIARCVEIRSPRQALFGSLAAAANKEIIDNEQDKFLLGKFKNSEDIPINRSVPTVLAPGQTTSLPITFVGQGPRNNFGSIFVGRIQSKTLGKILFRRRSSKWRTGVLQIWKRRG
jgi:hypothetical protein